MPNLNLPPGVELLPITRWENRHENFKQKLVAGASFKLHNPDLANEAAQYRATTQNLQWLIGHAQAHQLRLRAVGSGWSFSKVMVTEGGLVDTKSLRLSFRFGESHIHPAFLAQGKSTSHLFFAQCGLTVMDLNVKLEQDSHPAQCLRASGNSNGQTIVGAFSTNTHGSAYEVGSVQDSIVGLHVVVGPARHVWLERTSYPIATPKLVEWLGAELIRDDEVFNAALVSFGSFGFIHGVMLETEDRFLLEQQRFRLAYTPAVEDALQRVAFGELPLPHPVVAPGRRLYHLDVVLNPHSFEPGHPDKGIYVRTLYKVPYHPNYPRRPASKARFVYGDDTLGAIQTILDETPRILNQFMVPRLVNQLFPVAFVSDETFSGTVGEVFSNTRFRGQAASAAVGIRPQDLGQVLRLILAANRQRPFAGALALRFVRATEALLGFTCFAPTCVLELDGVDSRRSRQFFEQVWHTLEQEGIPYTLHWGKLNYILDRARVRAMYGPDKVGRWLAARSRLLGHATRQVFTSEFVDNCGLNDGDLVV
jgi:hypothetical protein